MAFTIRLNNVAQAFEEAQAELERLVGVELSRRTLALLEELRSSTPVETGRAREGWEIGTTQELPLGEQQVRIFNNVPYIAELNMGSSRQAGPRFVERSVLQYFTPNGVIATVRR